MEGRILYRKRPGCLVEVFGTRLGTHAEIRESADRLLAELRAEHPRARVWVNGRGLRTPTHAAPPAAGGSR